LQRIQETGLEKMCGNKYINTNTDKLRKTIKQFKVCQKLST